MDNVSDSHQSIELAKTFLDLPYHVESLVVVTARSQSVLELLGIKRDACLEMPDLGEGDAMKLFLHHAVGGNKFFEDEEMHDIMTCVGRCYFSKGHGQGHHYHPLALRSLGLQLGCFGESPSLWVKHLPRARAFNSLSGDNPVFDILRSGFDLLREEDQTLFMDVGCFFKRVSFISLLSMLCIAHQKDEEMIKIKLEHLGRKGLLEHVDLRFDQVIIHDLYLEFIELELGGAFSKSSNLSERMWVNIEDGDMTKLKYKPQGRCWDKLIRLRINCSDILWARSVGEAGSLKGIKWKYFANIGVLQLEDVHLEHGSLNLAGLVCLRILNLYDIRDVKEIEGLGELENLTHFECYRNVVIFPIRFFIVGQLPASLKLLKIQARAVLASNVLAKCHNLVQLELLYIDALSLDLSNCWYLESVLLWGIKMLHTLLGLGTCQASCLQSLTIRFCQDLVHIPGIDHLICLRELDFDLRWELPMPNFRTLTKLQVLSLYGNVSLALHVEGSIPLQLQKLRLRLSKSSERLNLNGFNQLEVLDLRCSYTLTTLATLEDLPKLRCLIFSIANV